MSNYFESTKSYIKRAVWLIPVLLSAVLCMYFINLFERIDESLLKRQIDERDTISEFAHFIQKKDTLYTYLDIIDRFEDNNLYLLDKNFNLLPDRRHTKNCLYSIYKVDPPFEQENFKQKMNERKVGHFTHELVPGTKLEFQYRHMKTDGKDYILLIGVHNYPKTAEEKELYFAVGLLLLFTAICNWVIVAYAKHMRYLCQFNTNDDK